MGAFGAFGPPPGTGYRYKRDIISGLCNTQGCSPGTYFWYAPSDTQKWTAFRWFLVGAGGGGDGSTNTGGSGGAIDAIRYGFVPGQQVSCTIGAAGTQGNPGGDSSVAFSPANFGMNGIYPQHATLAAQGGQSTAGSYLYGLWTRSGILSYGADDSKVGDLFYRGISGGASQVTYAGGVIGVPFGLIMAGSGGVTSGNGNGVIFVEYWTQDP